MDDLCRKTSAIGVKSSVAETTYADATSAPSWMLTQPLRIMLSAVIITENLDNPMFRALNYY